MPTQPNHDSHDEKSRLLFNELDRLQIEIDATGDNKQRRRLEHDKARSSAREFAKHLLVSETGPGIRRHYSQALREVIAYRRIDGVPSRARKAEAEAWMSARSIAWDGSAPRLRDQVRKALEEGAEVPEHHFGLLVEWTVRIRISRFG